MMAGHLSAFLFALVPVIAFGLVLLYWRSDRLYVHHLVFTLHLQAFLFIAMMPRMILGAALPAGVYLRLADPLMWASLAAFSVYALFAVRRFYAQGRWKTALKTLLLVAWYGIALVLSILTLVAGFALYRAAPSLLW